MDNFYSPSSSFYNIYYKDDENQKHITFNLTQKDLNFIFSYYGKDNIYSIEKQQGTRAAAEAISASFLLNKSS